MKLFLKRERDGGGKPRGAGASRGRSTSLHDYTGGEGGSLASPLCVRDWFTVIPPDCKKMAHDRQCKAGGYHSPAESCVGWVGYVVMHWMLRATPRGTMDRHRDTEEYHSRAGSCVGWVGFVMMHWRWRATPRGIVAFPRGSS